MKFKNNWLLALFILFTLVSCQKMMDYSEVNEYDKDDVFASYTRAASFVNSIYGYMDNGLYGPYSGGALMSSACDESEFSKSNSNVHNVFNGVWTPANTITNTWTEMYYAIRACNFYLERCGGHTFDEYRDNEDYKEQMDRYNRLPYEVRVLRAYFYFNLVKTYGNVPLITKTLSTTAANSVKQTSATEVLKFIALECEVAKAYLPSDYLMLPLAELGRVTNLTAMALKGRALMYRASPLFNTENNEQFWIDAAIANLQLIQSCESNGKSLGAYTDIWGANNNNASETIFSRHIGDWNDFERVNFPIGVEGGNGGNCPTQTLVDAYTMKSGRRISDPISGYNPQDPYIDRDPRLAFTIACNGVSGWPAYNNRPLEIYYGGANGLPLANATSTGYYLRKYCDISVDLRPNSTNKKLHSWVIFRLGEAYLNYAESALYVLKDYSSTNSKLTLSPIDAVNKLRMRSDVEVGAIPNGITFDDFEQRLREERMVELAFEGHRYWDVRRWKIGDTQKSIKLMNITKVNYVMNYNVITKERTWHDKMYFHPISQAEINKNPQGITQNTGW